MNSKYILTLAVSTMATLVLAAPRGDAAKQPTVFHLKSQGKTIAQLRVEPGTSCEVSALTTSSKVECDKTTGAFTASNGATLQIISGTNSVTVTADEIEGRPGAK